MAVHDTHDLGRLYWHLMRVPWHSPVLQLNGESHEVEEPWRIGRCWVWRLLCFLPFALVVGWWGPARTRAQMLADEAGEVYAAEDELAGEAEGVSVQAIREGFAAPPAQPPRHHLYEVR